MGWGVGRESGVVWGGHSAQVGADAEWLWVALVPGSNTGLGRAGAGKNGNVVPGPHRAETPQSAKPAKLGRRGPRLATLPEGRKH